MRNKIFKGWNTMRIVRLIIGIAIIAEGIHSRDVTLIIGGTVVSFLPLLNVGCCCGNSCELPGAARRQGDIKVPEE